MKRVDVIHEKPDSHKRGLRFQIDQIYFDNDGVITVLHYSWSTLYQSGAGMIDLSEVPIRKPPVFEEYAHDEGNWKAV